MAMVWIRVLPTAQKRDVNLPETVAHRSTSGDSLFLVPGQSREVTSEEWEHIKSEHADFLGHIQVLSGD